MHIETRGFEIPTADASRRQNTHAWTFITNDTGGRYSVALLSKFDSPNVGFLQVSGLSGGRGRAGNKKIEALRAAQAFYDSLNF
jgi:hypothetical protein